jgi:hypothetical protein
MTESVEARFSTFVHRRYGFMAPIIHQPWSGVDMMIDTVVTTLALPVNRIVPRWDDPLQVSGWRGMLD